MSIARKGVVFTGEYSGWVIVFVGNRDGDADGYYLDLKKINVEGFDYWFEHEAGVQAQLINFDVEWLVW